MHSKIIVFDLDHTIGYFGQFIHILNNIEIDKINDSYIYLLDLFTECFRPNIFQLFEYLILKRKEKRIQSIILYTNNNNDIFIHKIIEYIDYKLSQPLFDIIITPLHPKRKKKYKDYRELIECSEYNEHTHICFIDNKKHIGMVCDKISYIQCEPYIHIIQSKEVFKRIKQKIAKFEKHEYMLNLNNQKRLTDQIYNGIKTFIKSKCECQSKP